jgi:hypothetical protein
VLTVTITNSTVGAVWPVAWARIIARAPASYALLVALFVGSIVAWWLGSWAAAATLGRVPLLGGLLVVTVDNLLAFAQAALVGGFLRRNAAALGYD